MTVEPNDIVLWAKKTKNYMYIYISIYIYKWIDRWMDGWMD